VAERDGDGVRFRWADSYRETEVGPATPAAVQRMAEPAGPPPLAAQAPAETAPSAAGSAAAGPPETTAASLDELAGQLYDRIRDRLSDELRRDRERAGLATGLH
jgi:hypothetical protein